MTLRFRRSIKLMPGVRLNFGKHGISTTIGGRGASVNIRKEGAYLNAGIPGTGISERSKIMNFDEASSPLRPQPVDASTSGSFEVKPPKKSHKRLLHLAIFFATLLLVGVARSVSALVIFLMAWGIYAVVVLGIRIANKVAPKKE